ncbi:unnamed protein product [Rotaria magnacalcarata]|uniref:Uncharacterized protein n=1 Tax=Rotaria magnacalcarata TaxID=392030 RepID=A0A816QUM3_9BILA|nr:unnamed protein product [Rotaria magnacalcarata]CAF1619465.1 unnamed protein product [Rotaria magnacalcarata]CAF2066500.1 unnamed protein product [Rotaria magnacalcarata]CAF2067486.1 unnamed protein product [Rotaria magnacalcarata]CAF3804298.1 unnamed protein product [Rotaria magnacalcarata]
MVSEKVTIKQAVQKLSKANDNSNARLNALETKPDEIHLNLIEQNKNMNMNVPIEIVNVQEKIINQIETIQKRTKELQDTTTSKLEEKQQQWEQLTDNIQDMRTEMKKSFSSTINESFDNGQSDHHNITERRHHADIIIQQTSPMGYTTQTTRTIVIPPSTAIPTFNGNI